MIVRGVAVLAVWAAPLHAQAPFRSATGFERAAAPQVAPSPGGAALRSLIVPGLGQLATGQRALGVLFMGSAAASLGFGVASVETTVRCRAPSVNGACPSGQVEEELTRRPYLLPGLGGYAAIAVLSALHARSAAAKLGGSGSAARQVEMPLDIRTSADGQVSVGLVKVRLP